MGIKITIEHDGGGFLRCIEINRVADDADHSKHQWDCEHTYEATIRGRRNHCGNVEFKHRYGDPLHVLFAEAVAALVESGQADPALVLSMPSRVAK